MLKIVIQVGVLNIMPHNIATLDRQFLPTIKYKQKSGQDKRLNLGKQLLLPSSSRQFYFLLAAPINNPRTIRTKTVKKVPIFALRTQSALLALPAHNAYLNIFKPNSLSLK